MLCPFSFSKKRIATSTSLSSSWYVKTDGMAFGLIRYNIVCAWPAEFCQRDAYCYWPAFCYCCCYCCWFWKEVVLLSGTIKAGLRYLCTCWLKGCSLFELVRSGEVAAAIFFTSDDESDYSRHSLEWETRTTPPSSPPDEQK